MQLTSSPSCASGILAIINTSETVPERHDGLLVVPLNKAKDVLSGFVLGQTCFMTHAQLTALLEASVSHQCRPPLLISILRNTTVQSR